MSAADPLWITEAEVVELIDLPQAIAALRAGLALEAAGAARNLPKTQLLWGDGETLHTLGAAMPGAGLVGAKTWAHAGGGACPLLILWDTADGRLAAVIEAFALGQMRTGAMSGVATGLMAAEDAGELAIIGSGRQALTQVAAVAAVRPLSRLRVFSPTPENRRAFCRRVAAEGFGFAVAECGSVAEAVDGAPIITLVTRAAAPFLTAAMVAPGAHVNAVGAIGPERAELAQDLFPRAAAVAADLPSSVRRLSAEFMRYYDDGPGNWEEVRPISALLAEGWRRPAGAGLTLFKAMGMGVSDLALAVHILKGARDAGLGRKMPHPARARPRLTMRHARSREP